MLDEDETGRCWTRNAASTVISFFFMHRSANPMCPEHNDTVEPSNNDQQEQHHGVKQKRSQTKDENSSLFGSEEM